MKLKVTVPVWGIAAEDGGKFLTFDGLLIRAFSRTEAESFIAGQQRLGLMDGVRAEELGTMVLAVEFELSEENLASLREALMANA